MPKTIVQKVVFKNTTTKVLYNIYLNSKKHSDSTGSVAQISSKEVDEFSAYEGYITGKNIKLIKDTLIVQLWRGSDWDSNSTDSTFMMYLEQKGENVVLHVVHSNLPDEHADGIDKGWHEYYWQPWRNYIAKSTKS